MAFQEPYTTSDGFGPMTKGMHSGLDPLLLDSNGQYAYGVNVTTRGGFVKTRPAFEDLGVVCPSGYQGAGVFRLDESEHLAVVSNGTLYIRNGETGAITSIPGYLQATGQVFLVQAYRWLIVQDGISRPLVVQESGGVFTRVARDAELEPDADEPLICLVPGTVGLYAHGRYHYVPAIVPAPLPKLLEDGLEYTNADEVPIPVADTPDGEYDGDKESGKACFVSSDVMDPLDPFAMFRMTEHRSLDEGGAYALPAELGFIHGMGAMRGAATGTGIGSLYVFGSRGVSAFEVSSPRSSINAEKSWKDIAFSQVAFYGAGTYSPLSVLNITDDIWYVDTTKNLRSVTYDRSQLSSDGYAAPAMYNVSKSFEARRWVDLTPDSYRAWISAANADNRLHWSLCDGAAVGSLDFAQVYTATPSEIPPLHEGIWTGFDFKQVLSSNGALHAIVGASDGLHILRLSDTEIYDPKNTPIESFIVTKYYAGMYNEMYHLHEPKKLAYVDMLVAGISCPTELKVYFRPIHYPTWTLLGTKEFNVLAGSPAQVRTRVKFSVNPATVTGCNEITKETLYVGHAFQFRLVWTGRMQIDRFTVAAPILDEAPRAQCQDDNPELLSYPDEEFHDFDYEVEL